MARLIFIITSLILFFGMELYAKASSIPTSEIIHTVKLNSIGLERVNQWRTSKGLPKLSIEPADIKEEFSNKPHDPMFQNDADSIPSSVDNSKLASFPPIGDQRDGLSSVAWASTYYQASHELGLANNYNNKMSTAHVLSPKWTYHFINMDTDAGMALANQALLNGHVLTAETSVVNWQTTKTKNDPATTLDDPYVGQYAVHSVSQNAPVRDVVTIVGYNDTIWIDINNDGVVDPGEKGAFLVAGSWGTQWGTQGFAWVAYDAFRSQSTVPNRPPRVMFLAADGNDPYIVRLAHVLNPSDSPQLVAQDPQSLITITLTSPTQGSVISGVIPLKVDIINPPLDLWYVCYIPDCNGITCVFLRPYQTTWQTTYCQDGPHNMIAKAYTYQNVLLGESPVISVTVANSTCARANPGVVITPSSQTGAPGTTLSYSISIKNNDTSTLCGSSTFALSSAAPSGFVGTLVPATISLQAGSTATATLNMLSPTNALPGSNTLQVTAKNSNFPTFIGTGSATYTVSATCVRANPTLTLSPTSANSLPGATVSYSGTIKNNDSTACPDTSFTLSSVVPTGFSGVLSPNSIQLKPGNLGTVQFNITSPGTASPASYSFSLIATNSAATNFSSTATGTLTLLAACVRSNPTFTLSTSSISTSPGSTASYSGTMKNNDSATCPTSSFTLSSVVPIGFTGVFNPASLQLNPGSSGTVNFNLTSPATTALGTYTFSLKTTNAAATNFSSTVNGTLNLLTACIRANPVIVISPLTQGGKAGSALAYTLTINNKDNSTLCGAPPLNLTFQGPSGFVGNFNPTSIRIQAGKWSTVTLTVTSPVGTTLGNKVFNAVVTNSLFPIYTSTTSATYSVTALRKQ